MSTLGLELDRLELRVRNLERKLAEMENREEKRAQLFLDLDTPLESVINGLCEKVKEEALPGEDN